MALRHHAAGYFEALAAEADVRRVEDLAWHFGEIELLTSGGEFDRAFRLMNRIENEYLIAWGHTGALLHFRDRVVGHLGKAHYEVDNLIRMAVATSRQEEYDGALNTLRRARRRNYDVRKGEALNSELTYASNELAITLNIAGTRFDAGQVTKAATLYQSAIRNPMLRRHVIRKAKAHSGIGLCLTEIADFDGAIRNFELGLALIEDSQDDQAIGLRPRLMLNMGVCQLYRGGPTRPLGRSEALNVSRRVCRTVSWRRNAWTRRRLQRSRPTTAARWRSPPKPRQSAPTDGNPGACPRDEQHPRVDPPAATPNPGGPRGR